MASVDDYIRQVIQGGDEMSAVLEKIFSSTLKNSPYVEILSEGMNSLKVIRPPRDSYITVCSRGGDPTLLESHSYAFSVVERLIEATESIGAAPLAFANVIDASTSDKCAILPYAEALAEAANKYRLVVPNGEFAVLGSRVTVPANVSATMLGILPRSSLTARLPPIAEAPCFFEFNNIMYAVFDPQGKALYLNSDGVGTKTEFYERINRPEKALFDSRAMKCDDLIKLGATVQVIADVSETNDDARTYRRGSGFQGGYKGLLSMPFHNESDIYITQHEAVERRIRSYKEGVFAFNLSGSAVSTIDEERLNNPLKPSVGEYLVAIRGRPNPRSNGITDKRSTMVQLFGNDWHNTPIGKIFLDYLAEPSTVFYGAFKALIDTDLATSVYHMSGGAFKGKLARPLAKHGLFASLENLFPPDWRELTLSGARFTNAETAYAKWPMGNEGFVSTARPEETRAALTQYGLESRVVDQLQSAHDGITGIKLKDIRASDGNDVYFSGKD